MTDYYRIPLALDGDPEELELLCNGDEAHIREVLSTVSKQEDGLRDGSLYMRLGEVHISSSVMKAATPDTAMMVLAFHQAAKNLTQDERLLFDEVKQTGSGRYLSTWKVPPLFGVEGDGTIKAQNIKYLGHRIAVVTSADTSLTVVCLDDEVPKVGMPGPGKGNAPVIPA